MGDMAFDDDTFVSVYGKGSPKGTVGISKEEHAVLLKRESVNFLEVLAGADSTSGVTMEQKQVMMTNPKRNELDAALSLLSDTLVLGYLHAYNGGDSNFPVADLDQDLHKLARIVIKLAIIVMADFIA